MRDTGIGIDPADVERIFEPYFSTKGPLGRGLGLSNVRSAISGLGGAIEVHSELGQGSCFSLMVPVQNDLHPESTAETGTPGRAGRPLRLLLVEDDVDVRTVLRENLRRQGHTVAEAASRSEVLALSRDSTTHWDAAVVDLDLPGGSGLDVLEEVRAVHGALPGLVLTGFASSEVQERIDRLDDIEILWKPTGVHEIAAALHRLSG